MLDAFGNSLAALEGSHFFHWFSLEATGVSGATRTYRPAGAAFHDLVKLDVILSSGSVREMRLSVARSFIDDARNGAFALDLTKSFLQDALGDRPLVRVLEDRMQRRADIHVFSAGEDADGTLLTVQERAALQAYDGASKGCELVLNGVTLRFQNEADSLTITMTAAQGT